MAVFRLHAPRLAVAAAWLLGAVVLLGVAWSRPAEYDEQYTRFLLAGDARPAWPDAVFTAGSVRGHFHGASSALQIADDLRRTDVHPPLYFWAVALWSRVAGDGLFRLRLFSALCCLGALATVGLIGRRIGAAPALAMLLTLGCYNFTYTGGVARGYALAQLLLLLGVLAALRDGRRGQPAAGLLLGAASFANYLAAFPAMAVLIWLTWRRPRAGVLAAAGFGLFVCADVFFFVAQRGSRMNQYPPFHIASILGELAKFFAAGILGGFPLYVPAPLAGAVTAATGAAVAGMVLLVILRWRHIGTPAGRALLGATLVATPAGLLLLGFVFGNTPTALRYLAFTTPYAALLLAGAVTSLRARTAMAWGAGALALQTATIACLLLRPETQQPMRAAARAAAGIADAETVALLPRGNDGVGIVGAFITEAPDDLRVLLVDRSTSVVALRAVAPRVALAQLGRDPDSLSQLAELTAAFAADPCWRKLSDGPELAVYAAACGAGGERQAAALSTAPLSTGR